RAPPAGHRGGGRRRDLRSWHRGGSAHRPLIDRYPRGVRPHGGPAVSAKEVRFLGLIGLGTVAVFLVAFLVDPVPPGAGTAGAAAIKHASDFSAADRPAAFFFGLSGAGLLVLVAGLRQWLADISTAPRWWGTAMLSGA